MGCASSSPLVNGGGPGGLVDSAKTAATEVMSSGENAMNELGENITESVGQIKDTMVETVNGMANSIGGVINDGMTKIPLKDSIESSNHLLEENLENLKNEMISKGQSIGDETDKITDELIKDTEDVIRDAETGMVDLKNDAVENVETIKDDIMEKLSLRSPSHSIDTVQQSMPEPEMEKIMNGLDRDDNSFSPQATVDKLDNLTADEEAATSTTEEPSEATKPDENLATPEAVEVPMKEEDELVVEDIKDEARQMVERPAGKKLQKSVAVDDTDCLLDMEDEVSDAADAEPEELVKKPSATYWEELQDVFFKKGFSMARNASIESFMDDEEHCQINLAKLYREKSQEHPSLTSQDTSEVIDDLIKSFEDEIQKTSAQSVSAELSTDELATDETATDEEATIEN